MRTIEFNSHITCYTTEQHDKYIRYNGERGARAIAMGELSCARWAAIVCGGTTYNIACWYGGGLRSCVTNVCHTQQRDYMSVSAFFDHSTTVPQRADVLVAVVFVNFETIMFYVRNYRSTHAPENDDRRRATCTNIRGYAMICGVQNVRIVVG